jgi:HD-like signal output (HDOD) protein
MSDPKNIAQWIEFISDADFPLFNETMQQLNDARQSDSSHANEITKIILHDTNLTASVLKLANSAYFNRQAKQVSTISRAIVMLGVNTIHSLALSAMMLSNVATPEAPQPLLSCIANSFFRGLLARKIAIHKKSIDPEEAYIAGLLQEFGRIAFWHLAGVSRDLIQEKMESGMSSADAERQVLGFTLSHLNTELFKKWRLNHWILNSKDQKVVEKGPLGNVIFADKITELLSNDWRHPDLGDVIYDLSGYIKKGTKQIDDMLVSNAVDAAHLLADLGMAFLASYLPTPSTKDPEVAALFKKSKKIDKSKSTHSVSTLLEPNPELQLNILKDLSMIVHERPEYSLVIQLIVEGLHKGVGLERVILATKDSQHRLKAKYAVQSQVTPIAQLFNLDPNDYLQLMPIFEHHHPMFLGPPPADAYFDPALASLFNTKACFVGPLISGGKAKGLLYADQGITHRKLDREQFIQFQMFLTQAEMAINLLNLQH